ncbi:unnamed protein product [Rotaria sordida]|uniref:Copper type II ascorbate-dependent monooxygenase C-terminal domain-containing protein n=1 Tax=Rotaria sordida TaxID=392033 RepID=A0A815HP48_9BILA|nr:unnamed protein product [Rotaria sordida]CAF1356591.1 unnamed protein product [Rotaria sordida]
MKLFHCDVDPDMQIPAYNDRCTSEEKPMGLTSCLTGGIIGGPKTPQFLVLEVHFNNPYFEKRKYDAGIMEVGLEYNPKNSIPPGSTAFRVFGYCDSECTQIGLPSKNGRIITLNIDRHYSSHFQEIRFLLKLIKIEQDDTIIHTCIYNTEIRTNVTFGGYSINDEMCINYMHYYLRKKEKKSVFILFRYFHAKTSIDQIIYENYKSIHWTPITSSILQIFYEEAPIHLSCNGSDGNYLPKYNWQNDYFSQGPKQLDVPLDKAQCK